ncbi:threonine synthase [Acetivibrio mesophilus]|uniref:Threonine synthase n=1 Tax=Acetivibrio mesophilus TaxID=2487273 RepID=A0A4Q0I263_9FIRM|nr:threonine synthase [Acetivibrio mesophilus]ODM26165.1 threonine synthase [Clostridium sp. Bc-iso-3]RXE57767.1 threonine synthase [Acetivibrio mesophilus]HHV29735.1 threonine synthase [Clostridium sp.]
MYYESTRGGLKSVLSAEAIKRGIAPDGGLFVPEKNISLTNDEISAMADMSYQERALYILKHYLTDYSDEEIADCVYSAYTDEKFGDKRIAPLTRLNENVNILELWHGPTCAFKDMALQILPHFLVKAVRKTGETSEIVILVATSGDTGKAALEGFRDVEGTRIIVFYPQDGVSQVQKMQMVTQEGRNVCSIGVEGNFDDAQNGVKAIFTDESLKLKMEQESFKFSSANSINWGRLVPQIVYYFSAYADMLKSGEINQGDKINFVVPTGNFGNILAAFYAMQMGLPVNRLICASNDNNVLTDFINTGVYDKNREFKKTISPSMDILISSNLERLLFELTGHDPAPINDWMDSLRESGKYSVDSAVKKRISEIFWGGYSSEVETLKTIEAIYKEYGYVIDTHTAVGVDVYDKYVISTGDMTKTVIASTASPFKFNESVVKAVLGDEALKGKTEFELLDILSKECKLKIPVGLKDLDKKPVLHKQVCGKFDMKQQVEDILGL